MKKLFILLLITFFACSKEKRINQNIDKLIVDVSVAEDKVNLSELIKSNYAVVSLETKDESIIGGIDKILTTSDFIFVLDIFSTEALYMFNKKGEFIRKIGEKGDGPTEYTKPLDFIINENEITILDNSVFLVSYEFNGRFINKEKLEDFSGFKFINLNKDSNAFIGAGLSDNLIISDKFNMKVNSYFPYITRAVNVLEINPLFEDYKGNAIYRRFLNDTLYKVTKLGVNPHKIIDYQDKAIDINEFIGTNNMKDKLMNALGDYCITSYYYENKKFEHLGFLYEDIPYLFLRDIDTKKSKLLNLNTFNNDITFEDESYVGGVDENSFIMIVEPQDLLENYNKFQNEIENAYTLKIRSILDEVKKEDNPILLFVDYKSLK